MISGLDHYRIALPDIVFWASPGFFSLDCNVLTYTSPFLSIQYDIGLFPKTDRTYHMSKQVLPDHNKFSHLLDFVLLQLINPINFI